MRDIVETMRGTINRPEQLQFKAIKLPAGEYAFVPADLHIVIPKSRKIAASERHRMAYIPWENKYFALIPAEYRRFFKFVLPFLHARTSNVHTALSVSQLPFLLSESGDTVNTRLVYMALILHDVGWSQVNQQGLLASLSYSGVSPVGKASIKPKQQHLIFGEALAYRLLDSFDFAANPLSDEDIYAITEIIRRHDNDAAWERGKYGTISQETRLVCDADRLWSYTHENFWQDTIRKDVPPKAYLDNITQEIDAYFFTAAGRARAMQLIKQRESEVDCYTTAMNDAALRAVLKSQAWNPSKRIVHRTRQANLTAKSRRLQLSLLRQDIS